MILPPADRVCSVHGEIATFAVISAIVDSLAELCASQIEMP
jgi:hypothetical protein